MWNTADIDDLSIAAPEGRKLDGYCLNIRSRLMAADLDQYVVTPSRPARRWADDAGTLPEPEPVKDSPYPGKLNFSPLAGAKPSFPDTVFLQFPSQKEAIASSLGQYWEADGA